MTQLLSFLSFILLLISNNQSSYAIDHKLIFNNFFEQNLWGDKESKSGSGSNLVQTKILQKELPLLCKKYNIECLIDAPCGDLNWMLYIIDEFKEYYGFDIVSKAIKLCRKKVELKNNCIFAILDITKNILPKKDCILCRDCFVHYDFDNIKNILKLFKKSGSKYLLTTTFPNHNTNSDIAIGAWRTLDFCSAPFNFPQPIALLNEGCTEMDGQYSDKSLGLWLLDSITVD